MPETKEQASMKATRTRKTILIVEDDAAIAEVLAQTIAEETCHQAFVVSNGRDALKLLKNTKPDLLIINYSLPNMSGIEFYDLATKEREHIPTIMISANLPRSEVATRNIIGIHKPFELDELLDTVERLLP